MGAAGRLPCWVILINKSHQKSGGACQCQWRPSPPTASVSEAQVSAAVRRVTCTRKGRRESPLATRLVVVSTCGAMPVTVTVTRTRRLPVLVTGATVQVTRRVPVLRRFKLSESAGAADCGTVETRLPGIASQLEQGADRCIATLISPTPARRRPRA